MCPRRAGQHRAPARSYRKRQPVSYRIPVVGTGYRFVAGHRLRLVLGSDNQDPDFPAMMTFRHASVGTSSLNRVAATSRLFLPLAAGKL